MLAIFTVNVNIASMIKRILHDRIKDALSIFPAIALLGPRQIGKTTLSLDIAEQIRPIPIYIDLEKPSDRIKMSDPEYFLNQYLDRLVIMDEVQRMPSLFEILRGMIDIRKRKGYKTTHYLLLGSASKELLQQSSESLAGRIIYMELYGFNLLETGSELWQQLWIRGGFPDSFLAKNEEASIIWRESLITTYIEREIQTITNISTEALRRFWTMLAYNQGELLNANRLAASLGVSNMTIFRYLDLLVDLFIIRILKPWSGNIGKRLVKSPKIYIRDSGLMHALLNIQNLDQLLANPLCGNSFEGFVIENIASIIGTKASLFFYRTSAGAEVDLVLEYPSKFLIAVEIKKSLTPKITKSLHEAIETLKPSKTFIIYSGEDQYYLSDKIEVISLAKFLYLIHNTSF